MSRTSQQRVPDSDEVAGERLVTRLARLCGDSVLLLPGQVAATGRSARHGLVAVAPSGVYVVDAEDHAGSRVTVRRTSGLLRPATDRLLLHGRDRTRLLDELGRRQRTVRRLLGEDVPVGGVLCLVDAQLPIFGTLTVHGLPVRNLRDTSTLLQRSGPLDADRRRALGRRLAELLPRV